MRGGKRNNAGRPKGTPNKVNRDLRNLIHNFLCDNWEQVQQDFEEMEPKDRLQFYEKLLSYGLPKLQSVEYIGDSESQTIEILRPDTDLN